MKKMYEYIFKTIFKADVVPVDLSDSHFIKFEKILEGSVLMPFAPLLYGYIKNTYSNHCVNNSKEEYNDQEDLNIVNCLLSLMNTKLSPFVKIGNARNSYDVKETSVMERFEKSLKEEYIDRGLNRYTYSEFEQLIILDEYQSWRAMYVDKYTEYLEAPAECCFNPDDFIDEEMWDSFIDDYPYYEISQDRLQNKKIELEEYTKTSSKKRGAPKKNDRLSELAEQIFYLINIFRNGPLVEAPISNRPMREIYKIFTYFELIYTSSSSAPHKVISSMITQRRKRKDDKAKHDDNKIQKDIMHIYPEIILDDPDLIEWLYSCPE